MQFFKFLLALPLVYAAPPRDGSEPSKTEALAAWPSMLNCPKTMPIKAKKICWEVCMCTRAEGKMCLDSAPSDCKTKCSCSESAVVASDDSSVGDGEILLDDDKDEVEL